MITVYGFKVGDKVRITGNRSGSVNKVGDIGVIISLSVDDVRVQVNGRRNSGNFSSFSEIELAFKDLQGDIKMKEFKVGDKVRITGNTNGSVNKVGDIGIIKSLDSIDARVKVEGRWGVGNYSRFSEIEHYIETTHCSHCHQVLPEKTELQKKLEAVDIVIEQVKNTKEGCNVWTCQLFEELCVKGLYTEYTEFLKPFMFGAEYSNRLHPSLENNKFRLELLEEFKRILGEKHETK